MYKKQVSVWSCALLFSVLWILSSCQSTYELAAVEGGRMEITAALDVAPDSQAVAILAPYKAQIDSVMSPVIGHSMMEMSGGRPESLLSNLAADVLRSAAEAYTGKSVEVGITNMGGLRNSLPAGEVTFGNIYEIFPFENTLCILRMKGSDLHELFVQIASLGGECVSGVKLVINKNGELLDAKVSGRPLDMNRVYTVATIDYLAEGNDGMKAFLKAKDVIHPKGFTIRKLMVDYMKKLEAKGEAASSVVEGRITVK